MVGSKKTEVERKTRHSRRALSRDALRSFASSRETARVKTPEIGRFVVPIPPLKDGGGDFFIPNLLDLLPESTEKEKETKQRLASQIEEGYFPILLPNSKRMDALIVSGGIGSKIRKVVLESPMQIVPTNGTYAVTINDVSEEQGVSMKAVYDHIMARHGGVTREGLMEFFRTACGITFDPKTRAVSYVENNIGLHGDVFEVKNGVFLGRNTLPGEKTPLKELEGFVPTAGRYQKYGRGKAFVIKGPFSYFASSGTEQKFNKAGIIVIGDDNVVSAIYPSNINRSFIGEDGTEFCKKDGTIDLPTYTVGEVLRHQQISSPRAGWVADLK